MGFIFCKKPNISIIYSLSYEIHKILTKQTSIWSKNAIIIWEWMLVMALRIFRLKHLINTLTYHCGAKCRSILQKELSSFMFSIGKTCSILKSIWLLEFSTWLLWTVNYCVVAYKVSFICSDYQGSMLVWT